MAIASLQIAKLQGTPATAALKHYHWSIRRIAKNVRTPLRRTKLSTLAATLLLAYFEVWSSDHTKWCSHLFGARLLLKEIALKDMSRVCLPAKRMRWLARTGRGKDPSDIDYQLLSIITGRRISAEDYGLDFEEGQPSDGRCYFATDRDIEQYDILRDLFWWYAKMDVYQSILGGTKLFMEYDAWTQCPPRAPLSNINAIYGTYDHLILLLGRLASFTSRDVARKRKMNRTQSSGSAGGSPPQFPGIVPTHGKFRVPMGFSPPMGRSPHTDPNDDSGAPQSLEAAEQEWESIRQGFEAMEFHLGAQFKPLNGEYTDRKETPFGSALQYRTYSVAGIWMNYYMGLIHLYRSRPNMPPAAMQAAQVAAPSTAGYAIQIGRIAAGLADDCSRRLDVSTTLAAAFIESSFCLFVAAVQLQSNDQRAWVIQRMHDISRLTGWQSAKKIAIGCESAWLKAFQLGHGPEYKRPEYLQDVSISVWLLPRRLDQRISELDQSEEPRLVLVRSEQTNLAFGLLEVEGDLDRIELADDG
ncbi:transcriptional regulatory protein [Tolypocladium capitatum]|uniref:Transcriptional regulatory protein n=1 Tax=Tolypocladium capitatum TaxID=45235 RepID=A0A2K3QIL0_9HYPO|nr:transcriptional regulatory protein [Tolypocladium capitatum]